MRLVSKFLWIMIFSALSFMGCTPAFQGEYADPDKVEIVDDKWSEHDAQEAVKILINSALTKPWLAGFKKSHSGQKPVLVVEDIENRTDEVIDTQPIWLAIQDALINSGEVRFVNKKDRDKVLEEVRYQQDSGMVSQKSAKKKGRQTGADFMMSGVLSSQVHSQGELLTRTYQVDLRLTDLELGEFVWSENHKIKKRFKRSGSKW